MLRYSKCPIDQSENGYIENKYVYDEGTIICYFSEKVRHMTSKCRHLPKTRSSNAFRTSKKEPMKICVTNVEAMTSKIILMMPKNQELSMFERIRLQDSSLKESRFKNN